MQNSGVASGLPLGHQAGVAIPAQSSRREGADALGGLSSIGRVGRDAGTFFDRPANEGTSQSASTSGYEPYGAGPDLRDGAPSSAYLAQHIAQEVTPENPGYDRFQAGARAYMLRRDSTAEILPNGSGLDLSI